MTSNFRKMEDNLKFFKIRRRPHLFILYPKKKTTSKISKIEDNIKKFKNGRRPQKFKESCFVCSDKRIVGCTGGVPLNQKLENEERIW